MSNDESTTRRRWITPVLLLATVSVTGLGLAAWKYANIQDAQAASLNQPEPMESVEVAVATSYEHRQLSTSIGTVLALRSVTLQNELAGTVRHVALKPGDVVEAGKVLVALDVSVEEAELQAQQAQAKLGETMLRRMENLRGSQAVSATDVDRARAERDIALAQVARTRAIIERKTIRAPFRARVGVSDVHPGQYLDAGTVLTTLQGVEAAMHVDFAVNQTIAAGLREGDRVEIVADNASNAFAAQIVAVDALVDPATRNALVRARIDGAHSLSPGSSVRVSVPVGDATMAVAVPSSALRKGPTGDHVFVITEGDDGRSRAYTRPVQVRAQVGDRVVIASGLASGERVAASGSFKLHEAVLVVIANEMQTINTGAR